MDIDTVFDQIAAKRIEVQKMKKALGHVEYELGELESSVDDWRHEQIEGRMQTLAPDRLAPFF